MRYFIINLEPDYFTQAGLIWSAGQLNGDLALSMELIEQNFTLQLQEKWSSLVSWYPGYAMF